MINFARRIKRWLRGHGGHALSEINTPKAELAHIYQMRQQFAKRVDQPMVLISQLPRSGGSLLSQLFDQHPQCHTYAYELLMGHPQSTRWPNLDLNAAPAQWFDHLLGWKIAVHFREGYSKGIPEKSQRFPFLLSPNLLKVLFLDQVAQNRIVTQRDVIECYMTAYFNAWLDYQGLYRPKKYIVAFRPRGGHDAKEEARWFKEDIAAFFNDYPDGKLISTVRHPKTWYASAHHRLPHMYPDLSKGIASWKGIVQTILENKETYGKRLYLLSFESLLQDTEGTMRKLAAALELTFDDSLLTPTFQGMAIRANSAVPGSSYGILNAPLARDHMLSEDDLAKIEAETTDLYNTVLAKIEAQEY